MSRHHLYQPEPDDLAHRVCLWFLRHSVGEQLGAADVARMYDLATPHIAAKQLEPAVENKFLNEVSPRLYEAGPRLSDLRPAIPTTSLIGAPMATSTTPADLLLGKKPRGPNKPLPPLDVTKIVIEKNVPKPPPRAGNVGIWEPIAAKLKVGDSVLLPKGHAARLYDWAKKNGAKSTPVKTWSIRAVDKLTSRVWRDS